MKNRLFPLVFRFSYKSEVMLGLISIAFCCIFVFGTYYDLSQYYDFKTDYSNRLILGKLKVTYVKGASAKSSGRGLFGFIIGNKSVKNCNDCIKINTGRSGRYYDNKYENISEGDTVPIWFTSDFEYQQIVPKRTREDLLEYEHRDIRGSLIFGMKGCMLFLVAFLFARFSRKYLQKKYKISDEEYREYKKIAYDKSKGN